MKTSKYTLPDVTSDVCLATFEAIRAYDQMGNFLSGKLLELVSRPNPDPNEYDADSFRDAYWASEMWSKYPFEVPGINRENTAYEKFLAAEEQCRLANASLIEWDTRAHLDFQKLARARRYVGSILGRFDWDSALRHCSFGPGATTSLPRRQASRQNKWEVATHITERCLPLYSAFRRYHNGWTAGDRELLVVEGNRVTTVPKNAKTDRVIAIEPDWNMFFQRGIGGLLRQRLRSRLGLLTPDSQAINREAARQASIDGINATIDLSAASDSVSLALCEALLPDDWFQAMLTVRSHKGIVGEMPLLYEKVSSMGNGFTFELETLLFWALCRACCKDGTVLAYGDDLVVPVRYAEEVILLLQQCGFAVNAKKTFTSGPFRESCGGHYHTGTDVTPPYFRKPIASLPEYIRASNRINRAASQRYGYWRDGRFEGVWHFLADRVPKFLLGPPSLGDSVLHVPFDQARPTFSRATYSYVVKGLVDAGQWTPTDHPGAMFHSLWGVVSEGSGYEQSSQKYRVARQLATRWDGPPPWLEAEHF